MNQASCCSHSNGRARHLARALQNLILATCAVAAAIPAAQARSLSAPQPASSTSVDASDIFTQLAAIEGLRVVEVDSGREDYRTFELSLVQPADHAHPRGETFEQKLVLWHKDSAAPTILHTHGYIVWPSYYPPVDLAENLGGNELRVEHRFFDTSRPESGDWSLLNIKQAAADLHRVVKLIRPLYSGSWISTGYSKGGMTATYFRRFYPNDVDATVAHVAPLSYGRADRRYLKFFDQVGSAGCRQKLRDYQVEVLRRRPAMEQQLAAFADNMALTFGIAQGGLSQALDYAVGESYFTFWQYAGEAYCDYVPATDADDVELFNFLVALGTVTLLADSELEFWQPYYVQAAQQLGYPSLNLEHLGGYLQYNPNSYAPYLLDVAAGRFDWTAMLDIQFWVARRGQRIMFIYGDGDPWSAGAYAIAPRGQRDTYRFFVEGGNHNAAIGGLSEPKRSQAISIVEDWANASWREPGEYRRLAPAALPFLPVVDHKLSQEEREAWTSQQRLRQSMRQ